MKKVISILLVMIIVTMSFASCGGKKDGEEAATVPAGTTQQGSQQGLTIGDEDHVALGTPAKTLDPKAVYSKVKYTPEMFRGDYRLLGGDEANKKHAESSEYINFTFNDTNREISVLPIRIEAGKNTMIHAVCSIEGYEWATVSFSEKTAKGDYTFAAIFCAYSIEGNKIIFKPLSNYSFDKATNKISYAFSDTIFEYEFSFSGRNLTLSSGGKSVTLTTGLKVREDKDYIYTDNYISPNSKKLENIEQFYMLYDETDASLNRLSFEIQDNKRVYQPVILMQDNGLMTMTIPFETGTKTYQFVYFYCGEDGIVLTDGDNTYYYNLSYREYNNLDTNKYLSEDQTGKLDSLTDAELEAIVEKKDNLLDELATAFAKEGIKVTINEEYGELLIDSSVIFGGDSAELTADGKAFLNKFLKAYTSIVFSSKYENFVLKTVVEGHTAPLANSTYESGLPLSQQRADVVKDYCLSAETGIDTAKLAGALEAIGYSNSKPIHDANGDVDMNASRRVSFKFLINLDA